MKAYKVVTCRYGIYQSALIEKGSGSVKYALNSVTKPLPKHGPLCCFSSLERAKRFAFICNGIRRPLLIFEATVRPSRKRYINNREVRVELGELLPPETVLCTQVRLVRQVLP